MHPYRYACGERIAGRYTVQARRRGGMSTVYLCLDEQTQARLALKTPRLEDEGAAHGKCRLERFLREADTWIALGSQPNIVRCVSLEYLDGRPWLLLEWVSAPRRTDASLRARLKQRGPLDVATALWVALGVARGLEQMDRVQPGLVHRDIKPGNLLLAPTMTVKIADFGLAQPAGAPARGGVGTRHYRPPEQWAPHLLDARSDLYALGVTLYESLTGRRPFAGDDEALRRAHAVAPPPRLPASIPAEVDAFVQCCLAKDPAQRPQSAAEAADWLAGLLHMAVGAEPPTASPLRSPPLPAYRKHESSRILSQGMTNPPG